MNCYKCRYRSRTTLSCDYILMEGHSRGCSAKDCNKYKEKAENFIDPNLILIEKLYYSDCSDREIARKLKISRYSVYTWRKTQGLEPKGCMKRGRPKKGVNIWNTATFT